VQGEGRGALTVNISPDANASIIVSSADSAVTVLLRFLSISTVTSTSTDVVPYSPAFLASMFVRGTCGRSRSVGGLLPWPWFSRHCALQNWRSKICRCGVVKLNGSIFECTAWSTVHMYIY
jgi:hypothetical protein